MRYRANVDGLRALAVVPVVLFHSGVPGFAGGYVGVDVFFVISGFLITLLLVADSSDFAVSLKTFYERRIRRIFPALFAMLAATIIVGSILLPPKQLQDLARAAGSTTIFASNVFFSSRPGYFDKDIHSNPLLHTWSLAVEEQFYIVFPLIVFALRNRRTTLKAVVWALMAASFAASVFASSKWPVQSFYLPMTRVWELMIGALLALHSPPRLPNRWTAEALCVAGLALLAWAIFGFNELTPFPSYWALAPCLGAALLIYAGDQPTYLSGRLLASRPLVFVGLISYSLYLWHWPIIVFYSFYHFAEMGPGDIGFMLAASLGLAVLSWRFIEQPFRRRSVPDPGASGSPARGPLVRVTSIIKQNRPFAAAGVAMTVALVFSAGLLATRGLPQRFGGPAQSWANADRTKCLFTGKPDGKSLNDISRGDLCTLGATAAPTFLLWGDSHAESLRPAVSLAAGRRGAAGVFAGYPSCPPILNLESVAPGRSDFCPRFNATVLGYLERSQIDTVILDARWVSKFDRSWIMVDAPATPGEDPAYTALLQTIRTLRSKGLRVILVGQQAEAGFSPPLALFAYGDDVEKLSKLRGRPKSTALSRSINVRYVQRAAEVSQVEYVDINDALCRDLDCNVFSGKEPLYYDEHHLSRASASIVSPVFDHLFASQVARGPL